MINKHGALNELLRVGMPLQKEDMICATSFLVFCDVLIVLILDCFNFTGMVLT